MYVASRFDSDAKSLSRCRVNTFVPDLSAFVSDCLMERRWDPRSECIHCLPGNSVGGWFYIMILMFRHEYPH